MNGRRAAVVGLAALLLNALASGVAAQSEQPQQGGRVVMAVADEPPGLHEWNICCFLQTTHLIVDPLLPDAYARTPDHTFVPEVLEAEASITSDPFTVTYAIRDEAVWSDGVPVSADDFVFTWRAHVAPRNHIASREGYELITGAEVIDPKTVRFDFRKSYADYKFLFDDIFPAHVLREKDLNRAWRNRISVSAGPFQFGEWVKGSHLTLVRNPNYWGDHLAYLDEVEFRFIDEVGDQLIALAGGTVDVIYPALDPRLEEARGFEDVSVQSSPGLLWEHLAMQFKDEWLKKRWIRRALAYAIDREAIVDEVIRPIDPDAVVLDSLLRGVEEPHYEAAFGSYRHNPDEAHRLLSGHGCRRGRGGIYRCDGEALSLNYVTTRPNPIRKRVAELVEQQLESVGIVVAVERRDPSTAFGRILIGARFDLFNFAWTEESLSFDRQIWSCRGGSNFTNYCNEQVDRLLAQARFELDEQARAGLLDEADRIMAKDVASLPLYQRPSFLAYRTLVRGLIDNPTYDGPTWNIGDWWISP